MSMKETQQVTENNLNDMSKVITTWQDNGMQYTLTATPIVEKSTPTSYGNKTEMVSVFEYLGGKTPAAGTGEKVYKYAINSGAKIEAKEVSTTKYTGKIMLYERQMLDVYFNQNTTTLEATTSIVEDTYNYDDLPF